MARGAEDLGAKCVETKQNPACPKRQLLTGQMVYALYRSRLHYETFTDLGAPPRDQLPHHVALERCVVSTLVI